VAWVLVWVLAVVLVWQGWQVSVLAVVLVWVVVLVSVHSCP